MLIAFFIIYTLQPLFNITAVHRIARIDIPIHLIIIFRDFIGVKLALDYAFLV